VNTDLEDAMVKTFLEEALENLALWEVTCLNIENMNEQEAFNQLFRLAHNLKGSSLSVGLKQFGDYIHKVEELMTYVKKGEVQFNTDILNLFFEIHSLANDWILSLQQNHQFIHNAIEQNLNKVLSFYSNTNKVEEKMLMAESDIAAGFGLFTDDTPPSPLATTPNTVTTKQNTNKEENTLATNSLSKEKENKKSVVEEYLKVNVQKLDSLINYIGEIVVDQNIMKQKSTTHSLPQDVNNVVSQMGKNIQELQNIAMSLRMMPLEQQFQKMHRIVRDLSSRQNKEIQFTSIGADVELDKVIVEKLTDPLTHLIRNAVDHGIESKEDRISKKKTPLCHIELKAMQVEDNVRIYLKDDGKGLDDTKILKKAIEKGLVDKNATLTREEIHRLIFQPGFSTKDEVSDISGRGVGLDVVNKVISELKGYIEIETEIDKGTTFTISLPSSLSIIKGVIVKISKQLYVLPESQLSEIVDHKKLKIEKRSNGSEVFTLRQEIIPVLPLKKILGIHNETIEKSEKNGVVIQHLGEKISFEVDEIIATQSIVLKQLSKELIGLPGVVATTVLGSGEPALVLNLNNLINMWGYNGKC
jgi:two-component system chemotaxis sensor kinase CheA